MITSVLNTNHFFFQTMEFCSRYVAFNKQMQIEFACIRFFLIIVWLIQVKDGKLLDEMAVSVTGLANKVGCGQTPAIMC